jgi:hypothetical protein
LSTCGVPTLSIFLHPEKIATQMTYAEQRLCPSSSAGSSASACLKKSDAITNKKLEERDRYETTGQ